MPEGPEEVVGHGHGHGHGHEGDEAWNVIEVSVGRGVGRGADGQPTDTIGMKIVCEALDEPAGWFVMTPELVVKLIEVLEGTLEEFEDYVKDQAVDGTDEDGGTA